MCLDSLVDVAELLITVGFCLPSMVLALPCRLKPSCRNRSATVSAEARRPCLDSSSARPRVDLVVHRSADIGSPRISGSTKANSAGRSPGSRSAARVRPPPRRRVRPNGATPESSSSTPAATVCRLTSAALATAATPPGPSDRASDPRYNHCVRSSSGSVK